MNAFGSIPDGWTFWTPDKPLWRGHQPRPYWGTIDHDFIVMEHGQGWMIYEGSGDVVKGRHFTTAGAACRAANELAVEKEV